MKFKKVWKALDLLRTNPRHNSLQTHKWQSVKGPDGEDVFGAYVEQNTPSAWRILFYYPKRQEARRRSKKKAATKEKVIVIYAILPHP